jgi:hypothetical protein
MEALIREAKARAANKDTISVDVGEVTVDDGLTSTLVASDLVEAGE